MGRAVAFALEGSPLDRLRVNSAGYGSVLALDSQ